MFLVTSHKESANKLIEQLVKHDINAMHFPIIELNKNDIDVDSIVDTINNDTIFCISPTSALYAKDILIRLDNNVIIAPGAGTANVIKEINPKLNIKFPRIESGINYVINNGIFSHVKSLSILGSCEINPKLVSFCRKCNIKVTNIPLYSYNLFYKNQIKLLDSILEKTSAITGIIVTSSKVADGINDLMQFDSFKKKFNYAVFITSHYQIADKLSINKLNIKISKNPSLEQMVNSIKEVI